MKTALILLTLIIVWLFSLAVSFVAAFIYCRTKKPTARLRVPTEQEKREFKRNQIEFENFITYSGRPQDVINDE